VAPHELRATAESVARVTRILNSKRLQGWLTLLWVAMIPLALATGWVKSVTFVSALSLWALVASHGAWWAAAGVAEEPVAREVVEEIVERTDVQPG
jgi:hypothetical protein